MFDNNDRIPDTIIAFTIVHRAFHPLRLCLHIRITTVPSTTPTPASTPTFKSIRIPSHIRLAMLGDMHSDRLHLVSVDTPIGDPCETKSTGGAALSAFEVTDVGRGGLLRRRVLAGKEAVGGHADADDDHVEDNGDDGRDLRDRMVSMDWSIIRDKEETLPGRGVRKLLGCGRRKRQVRL